MAPQVRRSDNPVPAESREAKLLHRASARIR
jgi:hypothetical protein